MPDLYIKNVTVFDGTGAPAFMGDVVCADGRLRLGVPDGPCNVIDGAGRQKYHGKCRGSRLY